MSAEKKEITHDSLQEQLERTLNILKQRETGCFTWHIALNEALSELHGTLCPLFRKKEYEVPASTRLAELKLTALGIINKKMFACYENRQTQTIEKFDECLFQLFETAKKVMLAETETNFQDAIADL